MSATLLAATKAVHAQAAQAQASLRAELADLVASPGHATVLASDLAMLVSTLALVERYAASVTFRIARRMPEVASPAVDALAYAEDRLFKAVAEVGLLVDVNAALVKERDELQTRVRIMSELLPEPSRVGEPGRRASQWVPRCTSMRTLMDAARTTERCCGALGHRSACFGGVPPPPPPAAPDLAPTERDPDEDPQVGDVGRFAPDFPLVEVTARDSQTVTVRLPPDDTPVIVPIDKWRSGSRFTSAAPGTPASDVPLGETARGGA